MDRQFNARWTAWLLWYGVLCMSAHLLVRDLFSRVVRGWKNRCGVQTLNLGGDIKKSTSALVWADASCLRGWVPNFVCICWLRTLGHMAENRSQWRGYCVACP